MKLSALVASLMFGALTIANAEVLNANGLAEVGIKSSGDITNARKVARDQAERKAIEGMLKIKLSADVSDPKVRSALGELRSQLIDNLKTSFTAEGDTLTAKTSLQVDSAVFMDLVKSLGVTSKAATTTAKVLFLIDEYYGVGTILDPTAPLVTEVDYSHDKSSFSDRSSVSSGSQSASSSSASGSRSNVAAAGSERVAYAASTSTDVSARDRQSMAGSSKAAFAGSDQRAAAVQDGAGGSAAAARSTQVAGARESQVAAAKDTQFAASQKSAVAGSSSNQYAMAASSERAAAAKSQSASSFAQQQTDVQKQNDVVNLKVRQVFPGIDNHKPADDTSALINQKLQEVVKEFGLSFTDEKDFRIEGGRKLTVAEIGKLQKFDSYLKKASQGTYKAKYLVYGTAVMQTEGKTPSGQAQCAGQLVLTSSDVEEGEGFISGTIGKRAVGSSDQNCRTNLAEALARTLADRMGTSAQRQLQQDLAQGKAYAVSLYSALRVPSRLRRDFTAKIKAIDGVVEISDDENATEEMRRWTVVAKGNFAEKVEDLIDDIKDAENSAYKSATFQKRGRRIIFCIEGKCPQEF